MAASLGVPQLALCAHQVYKVTAAGSLIGDSIDENITAGLDWLVRVIDGDYATLQARIVAQSEKFAEQDAARREAASAQARANLAARAAAEEKDRDTAANGAANAADVVAAAAGAGAAAAEVEQPKPKPKPKPAAPACFVTGCGQPAVRRAQAAGWQAVCDACGDVLLTMPVADLKARLAAGETSVQVLASQASASDSKPAEAVEATELPTAAAGAGGGDQVGAPQGAQAAGADSSAALPKAAPQSGSLDEKATTPRDSEMRTGSPGSVTNSPGRAAAGEPTPSAGKPDVSMPSESNSVAGDAVDHTEDEVTIISPNKMAAAAHDAPAAQNWRTSEVGDELQTTGLTNSGEQHQNVAPVPGTIEGSGN